MITTNWQELKCSAPSTASKMHEGCPRATREGLTRSPQPRSLLGQCKSSPTMTWGRPSLDVPTPGSENAAVIWKNIMPFVPCRSTRKRRCGNTLPYKEGSPRQRCPGVVSTSTPSPETSSGETRPPPSPEQKSSSAFRPILKKGRTPATSSRTSASL